MATLDVDIPSLERSAYRVRLRSEISSCALGSAIERHVVHGFLAYIDALTACGIDFVVRPFDATIFDSCKDRIGCKSASVSMLLLLGWATFAVTLHVRHETIGVWCAVILTLVPFVRDRSPHRTESENRRHRR